MTRFLAILPLLLCAVSGAEEKVRIPTAEMTLGQIFSRDGWDPGVIGALRTYNGPIAYRTYWTLRQRYKQFPQVYDPLRRAAAANPAFVEEMHRLVRETPHVVATSDERQSLLECVGDFRTVWAVRLLGEEMMARRKLDLDGWPREKQMEFYTDTHSMALRNYSLARRLLLGYNFPGVPRRKVPRTTISQAHIDGIRNWWLANKDQLPEVLGEIWGEDLLADPRKPVATPGETGENSGGNSGGKAVPDADSSGPAPAPEAGGASPGPASPPNAPAGMMRIWFMAGGALLAVLALLLFLRRAAP